MFAKPKSREHHQLEKKTSQTQNSPSRLTQKKSNMAFSVRYTDYTADGINNGVCGSLDSPNFYQMCCQTMGSPSQARRLDKLEERLSILSSQYDQFFPLLGLIDSANIINKVDLQIKKIQKKQVESEEKLQSYQQQLSQVNKSVDVIKTQFINGLFQDTSKLITSSVKKEKVVSVNLHHDNDHQINTIIKSQHVKLQDHLHHSIQELRDEINQKFNLHNRSLEDVRLLLNNESQGIHQSLALISNNYSNIMNTNMVNSIRIRGEELPQQGFGDIGKLVDQRVQEQIQNLRNLCEKEFQHLWRDVGVIQVYQQMTFDAKKKEKVLNALVLPDNLDKFERQLKINNAEQGIYIDEMESFNKENCQRLINELRNLEERIDIKQERLQISKNRFDEVEIENAKKEIEFMHEQFHYLKNQIEGTRKISLCELKKIEDKMEQIDNIRGKISNDPNEKKDLQRITLDIRKAISFQERISKLIEYIDENLKIVSDFKVKVDERLHFFEQEIHLK